MNEFHSFENVLSHIHTHSHSFLDGYIERYAQIVLDGITTL